MKILKELDKESKTILMRDISRGFVNRKSISENSVIISKVDEILIGYMMTENNPSDLVLIGEAREFWQEKYPEDYQLLIRRHP